MSEGNSGQIFTSIQDDRSNDERAVSIDCGKASAEELRAKSLFWASLARLGNAVAQVIEVAVIEAMKK